MTSLPSTAQIDKARNMKLPDKIYFHIFDGGKFGLVIRELSVCDAGSLEKAAQSIDDDTVSFHLLEDGVLTDASEDVAREWMRLNPSPRPSSRPSKISSATSRATTSHAKPEMRGLVALQAITERRPEP